MRIAGLTTGLKRAAKRVRPRHLAAPIALALVTALPPPASVAQQPDWLMEPYSTWTVRCQAANEGNRLCWMGQSLQKQPGGEQVLQLKFGLQDDGTRLVLLAPFGLLLSAGAVLTVDGGEPQTLPFRTCMPVGCIAQKTVAIEELEALKKGNTLTIGFVVSDSEIPLTFEMSLTGYSAAHARLTELAAN